MEQKNRELVSVKIDRLFPQANSHVKALASATIAGAYAIHGIKIVDSEKGPFVAMPQSSFKKGEKTVYNDIFHPISAEARNQLMDAVMAAYEVRLHREETYSTAVKADTPMSM